MSNVAPPLPPSPPPPPARKPLPPPPANGKNGGIQAPKRSFSVSKGPDTKAQKVVIFGTGGIGKSELAANIAKSGIKPIFIDIGKGTNFLNVDRVDNLDTWEDLRDALHTESLFEGYGAVVIDDLTRGEELATSWTIRNVPHEKGHAVRSVEGYGFGKGVTHVYESFLPLLSDLDSHARAGRWVICIAHECTTNVPNPAGEDWLQYQFRAQCPASGKASIRHRIKEWADHLLFIGYDQAVEDGKGIGHGSRTIYSCETPIWWAKSRSISEPIPYDRGSNELWERLLKGENYATKTAYA